jgi:3-dehydroquinate synthase
VALSEYYKKNPSQIRHVYILEKGSTTVQEFKNQIGTFHHPQRVFIVEEVLASQSKKQFEDALGELYKMAVLTPQTWGQEVLKLPKMTPQLLRRYLPSAVEAKYRIVNKDPHEKRGIRSFLNLGHTFGHVIELEQKRPHGTAVAIGLKFALEWSFECGEMSPKAWQLISTSPMFQYLDSLKFEPLGEKRFRSILSQDKKQQSPGQIQFVFIKKLGQPVLRRIAIEELIIAGKKYGFIQSPRV